MKHMVTGFLFSKDFTKVALVKKASPEWMVGMLNGIGGKSEPAETPLDTMARECLEELKASFKWNLFARLQGEVNRDGQPFMLYCFWACAESHEFANLPQSYQTTKGLTEEVVILWVDEVVFLQGRSLLPIIPNLAWLIPMALSTRADRVSSFIISEVY